MKKQFMSYTVHYFLSNKIMEIKFKNIIDFTIIFHNTGTFPSLFNSFFNIHDSSSLIVAIIFRLVSRVIVESTISI